MPDFSLEKSCGDTRVCGLDEVGRGPLSGPVVAACVYIPADKRALPFMADIQDSKKLGKKKLKSLEALIKEHCQWAVIHVGPQEIDEINILQASLKAMRAACNAMADPMEHALIDGHKIPKDMPCESRAIVKGDSLSVSIAAASILAKVERDAYMEGLHLEHPHYGWDTNVGYPSKKHLLAINAHGITIHHRKSFAPVCRFLDHGDVFHHLKKAL